MSKTLTQLLSEIQEDLNLKGGSSVTPALITVEINRAIKDAESMIHNLYEDYFFNIAPLTLVSGASLISMPTDIFAMKIRRIMYDDGSRNYPINRIRDINMIPQIDATEDYRYLPVNDATTGIKIKLYPPSRESSATNVNVYYIRKAKQLSIGADILDIPEFSNYILANAKNRLMDFEPLHPLKTEIEKELGVQTQLMIQTLSNKIPDDKTDLRPDMGFYDEFDNGGIYI